MTTLVDLLIAFTVIEIGVLIVWHQRTGRGLAWVDIGPNLVAGLLLMAAVRCALTPGAGLGLLVCVAGAGICHVLDLRRRLQMQRRVGVASAPAC